MISAVLLIAALAPGSVYDEIFQESVAAYDAGNFELAVQQLDRLAREGVAGADVFYNAGNAYYRMEQYGQAIASYERALRIDPGHENAQANLDAALTKCPRVLAKPLPPEWQRSLLFWHGNISPETSRAVSIATWLLGWAVLAFSRFRPHRYATATGVAALVTALLFGLSWYAKTNADDLGVAIVEKAAVRWGPSEAEDIRFELFVGDRVRIEGERDDWLRITTISDDQGWIPRDLIARVGPPYAPFPQTGSEADTP